MGIIDQIRAGELDEVELLEHVTDNDVNVAIVVAESEMATNSILDIAAHDRDKRVRMAAVNNPNISKTILKYLINDSDKEVAERARILLGRKN